MLPEHGRYVTMNDNPDDQNPGKWNLKKYGRTKTYRDKVIKPKNGDILVWSYFDKNSDEPYMSFNTYYINMETYR